MLTIEQIGEKLHISVSGSREEFYKHVNLIKSLPYHGRRYLSDVAAWEVDHGLLDRLIDQVPSESICWKTPEWMVRGLEPPSLQDVYGVPIDKIGRRFLRNVDEKAYQDVAACFLYYKKRAICADEVGLGKTIVALLEIGKGIELGEIRRDGHVLVLTKATLVDTFAKAIVQKSEFTVLPIRGKDPAGRRKLWGRIGQYDIVITNHDLLIECDFEDMMRQDFDLIIVDEAHKFNSRSSQRHKQLHKLVWNHSHTRVALLTATPATGNAASNLFDLMRFINPKVLGTVKEFEGRYISRKWIDKAGGGSFPKVTVNQALLPELHRKLTPYMIQRTRRDVGLQTPPVSYATRYVEMTDDQRRLTESAWSNLRYLEERIAEARTKRLPPDAIQGMENASRSMFTFMRMIADGMELLRGNQAYGRWLQGVTNWSTPKLEFLNDVLPELLNRGKVVVHTDFETNVNIVTPILQRHTRVLSISGSTKTGCKEPPDLACGKCASFGRCMSRRKQEWLFWNDEKCGVIYMTAAGEEGLNLQIAKYQINYDLPWNPSNLDQRQGRIDRYGNQHESLHVIHLVSIGSIEEMILDNILERKRSEVEQVVSMTPDEVAYIRFLTQQLEMSKE